MRPAVFAVNLHMRWPRGPHICAGSPPTFHGNSSQAHRLAMSLMGYYFEYMNYSELQKCNEAKNEPCSYEGNNYYYQ